MVLRRVKKETGTNQPDKRVQSYNLHFHQNIWGRMEVRDVPYKKVKVMQSFTLQSLEMSSCSLGH